MMTIREKEGSPRDPFTTHYLIAKLAKDGKESIWKRQGGRKRLKSPEDFERFSDVKVTPRGFRDHEKGGCYSDVNLYEYMGVYYADIECSRTMNSVYWKHSGLSRLAKF